MEHDDSQYTEQERAIMAHWYPYVSCFRKIEGRGLCAIEKFIFTYGLDIGLSMWVRQGRYCYEHLQDAVTAIATWDGQGHPPGPWIKYKGMDGELLNPEFCRMS